jgi:hypothetical protein
MIIINISLNPLGFDRLFTHDRDLHEIKVVYDHTRIASYQHLRACGEPRRQVRLLALGGERIAALGGGFSK